MLPLRKTICAFAISAGLFSVLAPARAATYTVTSTAASGTGSLAWAVAEANSNPGRDDIDFDLSGEQRIVLEGSLIFNEPVTLDGGRTVILAMQAGNSATVLEFLAGSDGSVIRNISIVNSYCGIYLLSDQNRVSGCALGTDWNDTAGEGNKIGVIVNGNDTLIGGSGADERNIISGNTEYGVLGDGARNLRIQGNFIGTDSLGTAALGNYLGVMFIGTTTGSRVGGARGTDGGLGEGNLFAGNLYDAQIDGHAATGNTICGNIIGMNVAQTAALAGSDSVTLRSTTGNWVGLPAAGMSNVICGNSISAIAVDGPTPSRLNVIQNNYIGVTEDGRVFPNRTGIILGGDANLIGGDRDPAHFQRNVISGNLHEGIEILGNGNTISGNYIGLGPDGSAAGNQAGVVVRGNGNLIGGSEADSAHPQGNLISGQSDAGILQTAGSGNRVTGNRIGLNAAGDGVVPNYGGISIRNPEALQTEIGGDGAEGNIVSGNGYYGIYLEDTSGHLIRGNTFGLNASGTSLAINGGGNVILRQTSGCRLGGSGAGERNVICGGDGIVMSGSETTGNTVIGNWVGVMRNRRRPSSDLIRAVSLSEGAHGNYIGLRGGTGNLLAYAVNGIVLDGEETDCNGLYGNTVAACSGPGIALESGANGGHSAPTVTSASFSSISGTAAPDDYIEVFMASRGAGYNGGSLKFIGSATADARGDWSLTPVGLTSAGCVCATASDSDNNTSAFSLNVPLSGQPPEVTPTPISPDDVALDADSLVAAPNPARDRVRFFLRLAEPAEIRVDVYNLAGERLATLAADASVGNQSLTWECGDIAPGLYIARVFRGGTLLGTRKVAVIH